MTDAGREWMKDYHQPCALHSAFYNCCHSTSLNASLVWTYSMFLPFLFLIQAPRVQNSTCSLSNYTKLSPLHSKTVTHDSNFLPLKHLNFLFKIKDISYDAWKLTSTRKKCQQMWKQSPYLLLLDSLTSSSSQLTREICQDKLVRRRKFFIANIP